MSVANARAATLAALDRSAVDLSDATDELAAAKADGDSPREIAPLLVRLQIARSARRALRRAYGYTTSLT